MYSTHSLVLEELYVAVIEEGATVCVEYLRTRCGLGQVEASAALEQFAEACGAGEVRVVYRVSRPGVGVCLMRDVREALPSDDVIVYAVELVGTPQPSPTPFFDPTRQRHRSSPGTSHVVSYRRAVMKRKLSIPTPCTNEESLEPRGDLPSVKRYRLSEEIRC